MAKNIIKLNRGDSYKFKVCVPNKEDKDNDTESYGLTDKDVIYFALLYPHQRFEDAILIKGYEHTDQIIEEGVYKIPIEIEPKDTKCLVPGIYYYTVKLQCGGTLGMIDDCDDAEEVSTIIERTKFIIND